MPEPSQLRGSGTLPAKSTRNTSSTTAFKKEELAALASTNGSKVNSVEEACTFLKAKDLLGDEESSESITDAE